jgi:hypothetical protein
MNRVCEIAEHLLTMTYWMVRFHISYTVTQISHTIHKPDKIAAYRLCDRGSIRIVFLFITSATTCSVVSRGCCGVLGCGAKYFDPPKMRQHLPVDFLSYPRLLNVHQHRYKNRRFRVEFLCNLDDLPAARY